MLLHNLKKIWLSTVFCTISSRKKKEFPLGNWVYVIKEMDLLFSLQQSVVSIQEQLKRTLMDKNWLFEGSTTTVEKRVPSLLSFYYCSIVKLGQKIIWHDWRGGVSHHALHNLCEKREIDMNWNSIATKVGQSTYVFSKK